jgi:serine/threonine protein kinase
MEETFKTAISEVHIKGSIVEKKYHLHDDAMIDYGFTHITNELVILNLLDGTQGFPRILDIVLNDPTYVLVMPYLGQTLVKMDYNRDLFSQILQRVAILHKHNIVHLDLKPANIVVDAGGVVSIIDFTHSQIMNNFAPLVSRKLPFCANETNFLNNDAPHTLAGCDIMGTYSYMAPELFSINAGRDFKADIWSLGCVMYEWITKKNLIDNQPITDGLPQNSPVACNRIKGYRTTVVKMHAQMDVLTAKIDQISDPKYELEKQMMKLMIQYEASKRPTTIDLLTMINPTKPVVEIPLLYQTKIPDGYCPPSDRLRAHNYPFSVCCCVDGLMDHFTEESKNVPFDLYRISTLVHLIMSSVFFYGCHSPYDVLCEHGEYMKVLSYVIKNHKLSLMYQTS